MGGKLSLFEEWLLVALFSTQAVLIIADAGFAMLVAPALLAAIPAGRAATRSAQTVRMIAPKLRRSYVSASCLAIVTAVLFRISGPDLDFGKELARLGLVDAVVLWFASTGAIHLHLIRHRRARQAPQLD